VIKFSNILQEIGVNSPHILKGVYLDGDVNYIKIDNYVFWDMTKYTGISYPYWGWTFSINNPDAKEYPSLDTFKQWKYFKYFKIVRETDLNITYGIPKSQVDIVGNINEIGINKPKSIKDQILDLNNKLNILNKRYRDKRWETLVDYGYTRSSAPTIETWLDTLNQKTLNDLYKRFLKLKQEIELNGDN